MTAEKTMELVLGMLKAATADQDLYEEFIKDVHNPKWFYDPVFSNAQILIKDCMEAMDRKSNGKIDVAAIKKLIKESNNEKLSGKWLSNGKYCFCNGFFGVRINEGCGKFDSIPDCTGIDFDGIIDKLAMEKLVELSLPKISELKANKAKWKAETNGVKYINGHRNKPVYDFGEWMPLVDAEFLEIMMKALPGCKAYMKSGSIISPLYFVSEVGDGLLCPINKKHK